MQRWQDEYKKKLVLPETAVQLIRDGDRVVVPLSNGQPPALVKALAARIAQGGLRNLIYLDALNIRCSEICAPDIVDKFHYESCYTTFLNRPVITSGVGESNSIRFSDGKRALVEERNFNVSMFTVSPMDKHGFFSTGTNPDYAYSATKAPYPHKVLVEVNEKMPRTYGNNYLHISEIDAVIENTGPLFCLPDIPITPEDEAIGRYIAELVPDRACVQLGIGGVPNAVGKFLQDKKDLSVHSEMICDSLMELYYQGVITSKYKTHMPGKWMGTFVFGTQKLYDFVDENPLVELWGAEWINNAGVAALNDNLVTVNTCLEVDLSGQVASESINYGQYTAVGGQLDFVNAAWQSQGGKSFIATYSTYTDKEGRLCSKIIPVMNNFITVSRLDVQYVVTEYGVAYLKGKGIKTRVNELIAVAHPDFRDWLKFEAKRLRFTD